VSVNEGGCPCRDPINTCHPERCARECARESKDPEDACRAMLRQGVLSRGCPRKRISRPQKPSRTAGMFARFVSVELPVAVWLPSTAPGSFDSSSVAFAPSESLRMTRVRGHRYADQNDNAGKVPARMFSKANHGSRPRKIAHPPIFQFSQGSAARLGRALMRTCVRKRTPRRYAFVKTVLFRI
jgi:hypothetical protein